MIKRAAVSLLRGWDAFVSHSRGLDRSAAPGTSRTTRCGTAPAASARCASPSSCTCTPLASGPAACRQIPLLRTGKAVSPRAKALPIMQVLNVVQRDGISWKCPEVLLTISQGFPLAMFCGSPLAAASEVLGIREGQRRARCPRVHRRGAPRRDYGPRRRWCSHSCL